MRRPLVCLVLTALACGARGEEAPAKEHPLKSALDENYRRFQELEAARGYAEAMPFARKVLELGGKVFGEDHPNYGTFLNNLARLHFQMGQYAQAAPLLERSLEVRESALGPDHPDVAQSLNDLGGVYEGLGQFARAERVFRRGLAIRERALDPGDPSVSVSLNNLAMLYQRLSRYDQAEPLLARCLAIREKAFGGEHPKVAMCLNNLAMLYQHTGRCAQAEPLYQRSLQIVQKALGPDHPYAANTLNNLGALHTDMGQYALAAGFYKRSLAILEKTLGPDHPQLASSLNNLATVHSDMGQYAQAEPLFRRSLALTEKTLGPDHPDVAGTLNNLACLCRDMGRDTEAETLYKRSLAIREKTLGAHHPEVAQGLNNLAGLYLDLGQYAAAELLYARSLAIWEKALGPEHPLVATNLNNLAQLRSSMGQFAEAEVLQKRSLAVLEKALGPDHPDVARDLNNLAGVYDDMGQYALAEPLYRRSLAIREKVYGPDHPFTVQTLGNLASLCAATGDWRSACALTERARRGIHGHLWRVAPSLSEREQTAFLRTSRRAIAPPLTLALHVAAYPPVTATTAAWLLNGKAIAQRALTERARLAHEATLPGTAETAKRLATKRAELAHVALAMPKPGQETERLTQLRELEKEEQALSKELAQALGGEHRPDPWVALEEVQKVLPPGAALVELACFKPFNFKAKGQEEKWQPARYVAWVIPPAAEAEKNPETRGVRVVDLGEAAPIDERLRAFRQAIRLAGTGAASQGGPQGRGGARGEAELKDLAALILKPLEKELASYTRWFLSPDGELWLAPWAALPLSDGRLVLERHALVYLVSGRNLVERGYRATTTAPLVFADPDYDLGLEVAAKPDGQTALLITRSRDLDAQPWARLPGTAREAGAIREPLAKYAGAPPRMLLGAQATEQAFKAVSRPKALVLSTHGFFLPTQEVKLPERGAEFMPITERGGGGFGGAGVFGGARFGASPGAPIENPLLRCGLVLAGANNRERTGASGNDGILTGVEIATADLRATELVVLSACDTGVGDVRTGEGVAGLRQCFQLAGAKAVLATLWQIPDQASARLMTLFFENLSKGQGKAEALRNAQLAFIAERQAQGLSAAPYFWAAFTLTGD